MEFFYIILLLILIKIVNLSSKNEFNFLKMYYRNTYCLFLGQMVIEKLLKALYAKNNKGAPYAPKTHDLLYLSEKLNIELTEEQINKIK